MSVGSSRSSKVTMTQPFLNLTHGNTILQQKRRTGMPQIMKPDVAEAFLFEKQTEMSSDIVWSIKATHRINTDIVTLNVAISTQFSILFLLFFNPEK